VPRISGRFLEKGVRHGPRLVEIEVDAHAKPLRAADQRVQVFSRVSQPAPNSGKLFGWRERVQYCLHPDAVDATAR